MIIHLLSAFSKIQPFFYCLRPLIERCEEKEGGFADGKILLLFFHFTEGWFVNK